MASNLIESYPDGYGDDDIISFMDAKGQVIEAVELRTDDTLYLVKISKSLASFMANFEEEFEKELSNNTVPELHKDSQANLDLQGQEEVELD